MPSATVLIPALVGAFVGAIGWLFVGLYIQRHQAVRQAKNAARAVYFEIEMNRLNVSVAREYGSYTPLSRASFERLLPELATWLRPDELHTIVTAYMGHAGYDQASSESEVPPLLRRQALSGILASHEKALQLLRARVFSKAEGRGLEQQSLSVADEPAVKGEADGALGRQAR